jgi:hypothetical protein
VTIELNEQELGIIESWYQSAAGESASGCSVSPIEQYVEERYFHEALERAKETKALIDKLGLDYHSGDEYCMRRIGLLDASKCEREVSQPTSTDEKSTNIK